MAVFISYSRRDKSFVNKLAANLVLQRVHVWIDTWELSPGDSLTTKIQEAIQGASALLVVFSTASAQSEWCKRELSAGLIRELEEKRVVVLPVLLEDCYLPVFIRDKLYADFRTDFDEGMRSVLEAIAKVTSESLGRIEGPDFHTDWAIEWGHEDGHISFVITFAEHGDAIPFTVITEVHVALNSTATERFERYRAAGLDWWGRKMILTMLAGLAAEKDMRVVLVDETRRRLSLRVTDAALGFEFDINVSSRRLGEDSGRDLLIDVSEQLAKAVKASADATRAPTPDEQRALERIVRGG